MATTNYANQITYTGNGPLDSKLTPVSTYNDLMRIPRAQRYISMTVMVEDEGREYWLRKGVTNGSWEVKQASIAIEGDDVEASGETAEP